MLRDRYDPLNLFERIPTLGMEMDPVRAQMDTLLADDAIFQMVKTDLWRRFPHTADDGCPSTPMEVILRMLVVKHLYGWSFPATTHFVADSLVLRQFCRIYCETVPDQNTLHRWAQFLRPVTLHRLLDHITEVACHLQVTQGCKLRLDGTVVVTNIHHPTDSTLLQDVAALDHHLHQFGYPPDLLTGDHGLHSAATERYAQQHGVREVVLPKPGKKSAKRIAYEQQDWFRAGRNWRAGIERRISGLKRRQKLDRCCYHGTAGMDRWVGLGVITYDLHVITRHLIA
jgi:IS5 family transposase